jgi:hypothetical protein
MVELSVESNGRIEKTAVYINGEQIGGIKELMVHISEEGDFDGVLVYEGTDKIVRTKSVFSEYLDGLRTVEPTFNEEEAQYLNLLTIQSEGVLENTFVLINDAEQEGITDLFLHIRRGDAPESSFWSRLRGQVPQRGEGATFRAELTYREAHGALTTENVFA